MILYSCATIISFNFRTSLSGKETLQHQAFVSHSPSMTRPVAITNQLYISMNLTLFDISHKWNHVIYGLCVWLLSLFKKFSRVTHSSVSKEYCKVISLQLIKINEKKTTTTKQQKEKNKINTQLIFSIKLDWKKLWNQLRSQK